MENTEDHEPIYDGPSSKSINPDWDNHEYSYVICLINGQKKKVIEKGYLKKLGYTKEEYQSMFPNAPFTCHELRDKRANPSLATRNKRSAFMTKLNSNASFNELKHEGTKAFWKSEESLERREILRNQAIEQHKDGKITDSIRRYFKTSFIGSDDQKARRERLLKNPISNSIVKTFIHHELKHLFFQSSYEEHFIDYLISRNVDGKNIQNGPVFYDEDIFYPSDFVIFDKYVIEIKSQYIEDLQESKRPGVLEMKKQLVEKSGYLFFYIKDKDYTALEILLSSLGY